MLVRHLVHQVAPHRVPPPKVTICIPDTANVVERRAVVEACEDAGCRGVEMVSASVAAAMGAGYDAMGAVGVMVVDLGPESTRASIVCLGDAAVSMSVDVGGNVVDRAIARHVRDVHGVIISESLAEHFKARLRTAEADDVQQVGGLDVATGQPRHVLLRADEVGKLLVELRSATVDLVRDLLARGAPDLVGDVMTSGVILVGGGARTPGLAEQLAQESDLPVRVADAPEHAAVLGAIKARAQIQPHSLVS